MNQSTKTLTSPTTSKAWELYTYLQQALRKQAELFIDIGKALKSIRDEKLYLELGEGGFDTFQQFLNNAEIGLRPSTAYLYIRIYEYYYERLQLTQEEVLAIPINRLMRLLPVLKEKTDSEAKAVIEKISGLTSYDYDVIIGEDKLSVDRPELFRDKETGKWIFQFVPAQVQRIVNKDTGVKIYGE